MRITPFVLFFVFFFFNINMTMCCSKLEWLIDKTRDVLQIIPFVRRAVFLQCKKPPNTFEISVLVPGSSSRTGQAAKTDYSKRKQDSTRLTQRLVLFYFTFEK
eukprot:TRINITY_DN6721_c0_g1_i3.p1 TRINITY_DN6721_c0_g1~~TRINITY_DN6721_c0_g1_i3.p1  ORF type:complete len:103 (-),score=1.28 TRINITY_DN6721_c0_g1_i3:4-312(-)